MRRYSILLIATLMGFILCACNVKKDEISLKNEEEVAVDLQKMQQSEIGLADTFSLSSVEILDRQSSIKLLFLQLVFLNYGVMVTHEILVLRFQVRILIVQLL